MSAFRICICRAAAATVATLLAASLAGCSSTSNALVPSALGESCTRTADCQSGLVCFQNTCSGAGRRVDAGGIDSGGAGGGLSHIDEACQTSRDCASGLDCVPSSGGASVCDLVSYGVMAQGKTCSGECSEAAHCCALPAGGLNLTGITDAGAFVTARNCEDILLLLLGGSTTVCAGSPGPSQANACFVYQTYCSCPANTWACNAGRCAYTASCQTSAANVPGGCAAYTRTRSVLNTTCDAATKKCGAASSGCATDTDCDGLQVVDLSGVTCRGGDCACHASACYLKCAKDLDCQGGYSCDETQKLCAPAPCSNDAECFSRLGKARAKCQSGICGIPCAVDRDCSPSGDIPGQPFNGTVCGSNGVCAPVGCTSDSDCSGMVGGQRFFCATPPAAADVHSAITN
jgi:hypothetical protein